MAPKPRTVTTKALQALLTRIGSASSGTKATLHDRFIRDVRKTRRFQDRPGWDAMESNDWGRKIRIMSIDMGIKNLAFCDVIVDYPSKNNLNATMEVVRWEKIDLVEKSRQFRHHLPSPRNIKKGTADADEDVDPYSLSVLSRTAYSLVKDMILAGGPDIILIEKQRWRSGGGSAIQQWTVRVNTLEGMLWAILGTLRYEWQVALRSAREMLGKRDYEVFGVDPKRVGQYWLAQNERALAEKEAKTVEKASLSCKEGTEAVEEEVEAALQKKMSRSKAEKKAKISILRSWLSSRSLSTIPSTPGTAPTISFQMSSRAESTRQALCSPSKPARQKKASKSSKAELTESVGAKELGDSELKKLDDVTDCLLQVAAWVSWDANRLQLQKVLDRAKAEDGSIPGVSDQAILDMVTEIEKG
ncbi:mitochondrial resolvase Ydc2 [Pyrenochaeta sp. MPI-SDFR-AT-0127]|nr:mitochondrial resolvase Ydc2 [Pyrenochaeta sp. MPI-SDFR-AT-0127]